MKNLKWLVIMLTVVFISLSLVGWGQPSPSLVVESFFQELKKGPEADFIELFNQVKVSTSQELSPVDERVYELIQRIEYEVKEQVVKKNKAAVSVMVNGPDLAAELMEYQSALIKESLKDKEKQQTTEGLDESIFLDCLKQINFSERQAELHLDKVDRKWVISDSRERILYLLFNLQSGDFEG